MNGQPGSEANHQANTFNCDRTIHTHNRTTIILYCHIARAARCIHGGDGFKIQGEARYGSLCPPPSQITDTLIAIVVTSLRNEEMARRISSDCLT